MKKITLTLLIVSLYLVSNGYCQIVKSNFPSSVTFSNLSYVLDNGMIADFSSSPLTDANIGANDAMYYAREGSPPSTPYIYAEYRGNLVNGQMTYMVSFTARNPNSGSLIMNVNYSGPNLTNLTLSSSSGVSSPSPSQTLNSITAGGLPEGVFIPSSPSNGGESPTGAGDVIAQQAQALNIGLSFNNGEWVPTQ